MFHRPQLLFTEAMQCVMTKAVQAVQCVIREAVQCVIREVTHAVHCVVKEGVVQCVPAKDCVPVCCHAQL